MFTKQDHITGDPDEVLRRTWYKLVNIESVGYSRDYWSYRRELTDRHLLIIAGSEWNRIVVDGQALATYSGMVVVCRPGQSVEIGVTSEEGHPLYLLYFEMGSTNPAVIDLHTAENPQSGGLEEESRIPAAPALCGQIHRSWLSESLADKMRAQAVFHELLALIIEYQGQETVKLLSKVKAEIDRHYSEEITIERLAVASGISRYHLMRIFRERYGKSIGEYLTGIRLHHAKQLMLKREYSIHEIAGKVGFQSESYFRTVFKKQVGLAPAAYLRNRACKVAAYSWPILGHLLPLQTIPYAAPMDHYWTDDYRRQYGSDVIIQLGHEYEFNRSVLRQAQPDLIIGLDSTISPEEEQRLQEIAPVLLLPWMSADWRTHLLLVAEALGRTHEGEQWLERYDSQARSVHEQIQPVVKDDKVLVLKIATDGLFVLGRKAMTVLYDDLQITPAPLVNGIEWFEAIEDWQLTNYDADRMIVSVDDNPASRLLWDKLQLSEHWTTLLAVQHHAVHRLPGHSSWVYPWIEYTAWDHKLLLDNTPRILLDNNNFDSVG
ncbi:helix-turn-helix domain-containing protein [Paenibacillus sp. GCM10012306]|uniref:helix-turn-helix domain-containing protein n=1 Tax=Paenibacillus sp. GCM10012306 TaxID=3317342 RepID=UPI003617C7B4